MEEFYSDVGIPHTNEFFDPGRDMLRLIEMINETFKTTVLYGLTSHARLVLLNADDSRSNWFVTISSGGLKDYYFQYQMTQTKQPWENASVHGHAIDLEQAKKHLLIAMAESGGWAANEELRQLLSHNHSAKEKE